MVLFHRADVMIRVVSMALSGMCVISGDADERQNLRWIAERWGAFNEGLHLCLVVRTRRDDIVIWSFLVCWSFLLFGLGFAAEPRDGIGLVCDNYFSTIQGNFCEVWKR